mmetsp:Transcript_2516/g.4335  ORF Transcript_2516/g.4335 Transcript_2516/m.4335 type:complete len:235 (-) Transcript_2516:1837-2541(-)
MTSTSSRSRQDAITAAISSHLRASSENSRLDRRSCRVKRTSCFSVVGVLVPCSLPSPPLVSSSSSRIPLASALGRRVERSPDPRRKDASPDRHAREPRTELTRFSPSSVLDLSPSDGLKSRPSTSKLFRLRKLELAMNEAASSSKPGSSLISPPSRCLFFWPYASDVKSFLISNATPQPFCTANYPQRPLVGRLLDRLSLVDTFESFTEDLTHLYRILGQPTTLPEKHYSRRSP